MKNLLLALIFGTLLALSACGGSTDESAETNDPVEEEGTTEKETEGAAVDPEVLIENNCLSCHGDDFPLGEGSWEMSSEEMEKVILEGVGSMPAIDVSNEEGAAIAEYLTN